MSEVIECSTGVARRHADGYVWLDQVPSALQDAEAAQELMTAVSSLSGGLKVPLLVLTNQSRTTRGGRQVFAEQGAEILICCALVVKSRISEVTGNFFLRLNKPSYPFRLFGTQSEAEAWVRTFVQKEQVS